MIKKMLLGAAIALTAAVGIATPASADPSPFGTLGCSCQPPPTAPGDKAPAMSPTDLGIQNGLGFLHGTSPRPADN